MKKSICFLLLIFFSANSYPQTQTIFAVVGDFGKNNSHEQDVANLIDSWNPTYVVTVGDNIYDISDYSVAVGKYYHKYMYPHDSNYGASDTSTSNYFWPIVGNHDWDVKNLANFETYFELPGNERYFTFSLGDIEFFAVDSDTREPDGASSNSTQAQWLQTQLSNSAAKWKIVIFHHPPYCSWGNTYYMRWPFEDWGADAILSGHGHVYERVLRDDNNDGSDLVYFVNGLGGASIFSFNSTVGGSQFQYNSDYGAMKVIEDYSGTLAFEFYNTGGTKIDEYVLKKTPKEVSKILVSGVWGNNLHDTDVKNAFLLGYSSYDGTQYTGQIDLHVDNTAYAALDYSNSNGYQILIRSYTGLNQALDNEAKNYPDVLFFMPAGSNSFNYVCNLDIPNASIVSTGAGVDNLVTGYKVEFFSIDPITASNLSSFSNGYIAGQIAFIANTLKVTPNQARMIARNYCITNQSIDYVQYGKIDIQKLLKNELVPVELISFNISIKGNEVLLNWSTATEIKNYGFDIERSEDGKNLWTKIGFISGHGNSNSPHEYSFIDKNPVGSKLSYRLKQLDTDGSFKYYSPLAINLNYQISLFQNYPNPFNPITNIKYSLSSSEKVSLNVYNILGELVSTLVNKQENAGVHSVNFNSQGLSSGVYLYEIIVGKFIDRKKMIILK